MRARAFRLQKHGLYVIIWGLCEVWHVPPFNRDGSGGTSHHHRKALVQFVVQLLGEARGLPVQVEG